MSTIDLSAVATATIANGTDEDVAIPVYQRYDEIIIPAGDSVKLAVTTSAEAHFYKYEVGAKEGLTVTLAAEEE
jgi:hypothetical protein